MSTAPDTTTPVPAKGRGKMPLIAGAAVLVLAAGGGAYWFTQKPASAEEAHHEEPAPKRGIVSFDPFVVNLADTAAQRFLRISLQLVVKDAAQATEIEESKVALMQARSAILEVLTTQTSDVLVTPEGKTALRAAIVEKAGHAVEEFEVVDVLFSDFVVQF
ncbi:MAG TPA: flagellar basal body-associated FliL family protein [Vicinamibacterales bacterium]|nr:flagellar basal body-associated FliL family protein [Vicinamibacterales bacterium]